MAGYPFYEQYTVSEEVEFDLDLIKDLNKLRFNIESVRKFWDPLPFHRTVEITSPFQLPSPWEPKAQEFQTYSTYSSYQPNGYGSFENHAKSIKIKESVTQEPIENVANIEETNQAFRQLVTRVLNDADILVLNKSSPPSTDIVLHPQKELTKTAAINKLEGKTAKGNVFIEVAEYPSGSSADKAVGKHGHRRHSEWGNSFSDGEAKSDDFDETHIYSNGSWEQLNDSYETLSESDDYFSLTDYQNGELQYYQQLQRAHLSDSYLTEPLKAEDLFAYFPSEKTQYIYNECNFVVQVLTFRGNDRYSYTTSLPFKAIVIDPIGYEHDAYIKTVPLVHNTYFGAFYPCTPGFYVVSVFMDYGNQLALTHRDHVKGSPFTVTVSRNYEFETRRVRIGIFGQPDSGVNPSRCWGITSDKLTDNIFISNREKHEIAVFSSMGQLMCKFGQPLQNNFTSGKAPQPKLYRPTGLCCDTINRRLLVADKDNHRIVIYSLNGGFIKSFGVLGHQNGQFLYPWDVDCSPDGDRIVVTDSRNHRVQLFDRFGNFLKKFTVFESCPYAYKDVLDNPRGVTFDHEGKKIYVTDFTRDAVTCINADLTTASRFHLNSRFGRLQGLSVDSVGNVLVCDTRRNIVRVIDSEGNVISSVSSLEDDPIFQPLDVTVMRGGCVAVLDYNGRVRIF